MENTKELEPKDSPAQDPDLQARVDERVEMLEEVDLDKLRAIKRKRAGKAFTILNAAIDAAMSGQFPTGLGALDQQQTIKGALMYIGDLLIEIYGVDDPEDSEEAELAEAEEPAAN